MNFLSKLILFITSYSPLFLIFTILNFSASEDYFFKYPLLTWIMIIGTILSGLMTLFLLKIAILHYKKFRAVEIIDVENSNHEILAYFFAYVLPFISVPESKKIYIIIILMLVTFFIFIKSDLIKYNIFLLFLGYDVLKVKIKINGGEEKVTIKDIFLIKHKDLLISNDLPNMITNLSGNIYFLK